MAGDGLLHKLAVHLVFEAAQAGSSGFAVIVFRPTNRKNDVYAHAKRRDFASQRFGDRVHRRLGRAIGADQRQRPIRRARGYVTMTPDLLSRICGRTAWVTEIVPNVLVLE